MSDYFTRIREIELRYSGGLPCINVGKPNRPTYFPIEVIFVFCFVFLPHNLMFNGL